MLPVLVFGVLMPVPDDPAIRLGLLLVLLVPCTDWFIIFAHQAGGDLRRAIAITPALLIFQMLLLPLYPWLFMGEGFMEIVSAGRMVRVFAVVILLPLALAWLTELWAGEKASRTALVGSFGWFPVPLLACVVFLIGAVACGLAIGKVFGLPVPQARTLVFTLTTRNSFVVLPFPLCVSRGLGTGGDRHRFSIADRAVRHAGASVACAEEASPFRLMVLPRAASDPASA